MPASSAGCGWQLNLAAGAAALPTIVTPPHHQGLFNLADLGSQCCPDGPVPSIQTAFGRDEAPAAYAIGLVFMPCSAGIGQRCLQRKNFLLQYHGPPARLRLLLLQLAYNHREMRCAAGAARPQSRL